MKMPRFTLHYSGNEELLKLKKTAFIHSRKIHSAPIHKYYKWAIEQREKGNCVICGYQSQIEKDVLNCLLQGTQPIIIALPKV